MFRYHPYVSRIGQSNATSGFDPIALLRISQRCNQWTKSNKKCIIDYFTYIMYET